MTKVWKWSRHKGSHLLVLLAIADCASDQGEAFPGLSHLAQKTRLGRRYLVNIIGDLERSQELARVSGWEKRRSNQYRVTIQELGNSSSLENSSSLGNPDSLSREPQFHRVGNPSSLYPSIIHHEPKKDMPTPTTNVVESANQSILIADQKKKRAESPKKKELSASDLRLEQFLAEYPRQGGTKTDLETSWRECNVTDGLFITIMNKLKEAKASMDWGEQDGKFIPYPAKWLKEEGWLKQYRRKRLPL